MKFWHLRAVEVVNGHEIVSPVGGLTVAYTICEVKGINSIFVNFAKCRIDPIVDKVKVTRRNQAMNKVLFDLVMRDGVDDGFAMAMVRERLLSISRRDVKSVERFSYAEGRKWAAKALLEQGPVEVLDLEHPIAQTIADWVAWSLWPMGTTTVGYIGEDMGFPIDIWQIENGTWVSDFTPAIGSEVEPLEE